VVFVDAFGTDRVPPQLCTQRFYDDCYQALTAAGLMVANVCGENHREILARIRRSFSGQVLLSPDNDGNTVVFASEGELLCQRRVPCSSQMKRRKFEKARIGAGYEAGSIVRCVVQVSIFREAGYSATWQSCSSLESPEFLEPG